MSCVPLCHKSTYSITVKFTSYSVIEGLLRNLPKEGLKMSKFYFANKIHIIHIPVFKVYFDGES